MKTILSTTRKLLNESFYLRNIKSKSFHTYDEAQEILNNSGKKVGEYLTVVDLHNKIVRLEQYSIDGEICVMYHSTGVICYDKVGNIVINVGHWYSKSSNVVINHFLPKGVYVSSIKGRWHVFAKNGTYPYYNGITLSEHGDVINPRDDYGNDMD